MLRIFDRWLVNNLDIVTSNEAFATYFARYGLKSHLNFAYGHSQLVIAKSNTNSAELMANPILEIVGDALEFYIK